MCNKLCTICYVNMLCTICYVNMLCTICYVNMLCTIKKIRAKWVGYILSRNCLLKHVIEGKTEKRIEVMGRLGRSYKGPLDDLKEQRRCWKLKKEALDRPPCGTRVAGSTGLS